MEDFLLKLVQSIVFVLPVCGLMVFLGKKIQKIEVLETTVKDIKDRKQHDDDKNHAELENIYNRINEIASVVNFIKGKLEGK
jgi:hypothetical protein